MGNTKLLHFHKIAYRWLEEDINIPLILPTSDIITKMITVPSIWWL